LIVTVTFWPETLAVDASVVVEWLFVEGESSVDAATELRSPGTADRPLATAADRAVLTRLV
jgi:predicted nucleic acid-binding protein